MYETRRKIIERLFSSFCYDVCSTCGLPGVHVVEDAVGGELEPVVAADVVVEHLELDSSVSLNIDMVKLNDFISVSDLKSELVVISTVRR